MGRGIYTGIYEPSHPTSDTNGFRGDVADLVRELGTTMVRYPGGNFVSGYDWTDGIGPQAQRPRRLDLAWRTVETNQVGVDEFLPWAARTGLDPMMAINLGTAGAREAAAIVEYCNVDSGTAWSDLRRRNGSPEPYDVRTWCLGNEMDGPWQLGHCSAEQYADRAAEAAKAMRLVDPTLELVACGSSNHDMATFGYWESTVLERAGEHVDLISMHAYYEEVEGDRSSFLASGAGMDRFIDGVVSTIDAVAARRRSGRRIDISFDEWNVWYQSRFSIEEVREIDVAGPRIEDVYSTLDAVVVGDLLISLLNHSDRVRVACLAQLVNVIAPIMTNPGGATWRQPTFHPFAATSALARGRGLVTQVRCPKHSTARFEDVPAVASAATYDPDTGDVAVWFTNRLAESVDVSVVHPAFGSWVTGRARGIVADDLGPRGYATAGEVSLGVVEAQDDADVTRLVLPAGSWTVLEATTGRIGARGRGRGGLRRGSSAGQQRGSVAPDRVSPAVGPGLPGRARP